MNKLPKITKIEDYLKYGLLLFVLLIPLADHSRLSIIYNKVLPVRVLLGVLILFSVFLLLKKVKDKQINLRFVLTTLLKDNIFRALGALWVIRLISLIQTHNINASVEIFVFYTAMIGLYVLLKPVLMGSRFFVFKLIRAFVYVGLITAFYGLFQYLLFKATGQLLPGVLVGGDYIRLPATFYDANHFAAYIAMLAPIVVAFSWLAKKFWAKAFWWVAYFLIAFVVLYSFSRSGLLSLLVGTSLILILGVKGGYYRKILPLLGALALAGIVVFISNATGRSLVDRAASVFDLREPSTKAHYLLLRGEVELFMTNPVFGIGYGSFSEKFRQAATGQEHASVDKATDIRIPAHSVWFEVITETGLVGLAAYLWFIASVFRSLLRLLRHSNNKTVRIYAIGFISGLTGLWSGGLFYSYNLEFFWFYIFLAYLFTHVLEKLMKEGVVLADGEKKETLNWYEIIPAVSALLIGLFIIFYRLGEANIVSSEAILATVAREMYRNTSWLIPTYQGASYLAYPPLFFWLSTNLIHLYLGAANLIVRFIPALFGLMTILITYLLGRGLMNRYWGFLAVILTLFVTPYVYLSRSVNVEIISAFFLILGVYLLTMTKKHRYLLLLSGVSLGLASLADGLLTLSFLPVFFLLMRNYYKDLFKMHLLVNISLTVFLLIFLPWHLYALIYDPVLFIQSYLHRIPNFIALTPLVSVAALYLTTRYYQKQPEPQKIHLDKLTRYAIPVSVVGALLIFINLPFTASRISPPNANEDLANLLASAEYQERVKDTLLLNGVSMKVAGYYTEGKIQEVSNYNIEKTITGDHLLLLITSADRGNILLKKFARDERGLRLLRRAGMLVLLANY